MPISAVDAITPAFEHARLQLTRPFRSSQWAKLGLVGLLAGEMSSGGGGCNPGSFQMPHPNHSQRLLESARGGDALQQRHRIYLPRINGRRARRRQDRAAGAGGR